MSANRRVVDDARHAHFVTFSVDRRRRLLDHDHPKRIVLGVLNAVLKSFDARCVGFVLMPKRQSSLKIREWYRRESAHYFDGFGEGDRFWQPKYHSFEIYEPAKLEEKLNYMHLNPVRAGLAHRARA